MPEQRSDGIRTGVAPTGYELRVEVHWCHECGTDRTVQIVQLTGDPFPVAVCADCGTGLALWLSAEATDATEAVAVNGRYPTQGAA